MNRRHIIVAIGLLSAAGLAAPAIANTGTVADEARLFDWVRTFWPIVVVFGGMLVAAVMAGLSMRFVSASTFGALRDRVDRIESAGAGHEIRLVGLEKSLETSPTRMELQEDIAELSERMKGVEVGIDGIHGITKTTNTYLQMIVDRGLRGAA